MADSRVERLARVLVDYSADIQPGDRVLIEAEPVAEPLVRAVFQRTLEAGGYPQLLLSLAGFVTHTGLDDLFMKFADDAQLDLMPVFYKLAYDTFQSRIRIRSLRNTRALTRVNQERLSRRKKATEAILATQVSRGALGAFKWVTTLYPTSAYAQDADMSLSEFEDFVYAACRVDGAEQDPVAAWEGVRDGQARIIEALSEHDQVILRSPNCDLSLSIKGRTFINACGRHNMPDGEVYTGPVEGSVEGWVRFTYPAIYNTIEVAGVELRFEDGKVVEAKAEKNQGFLQRTLDTDPGARYLGEFAVGTNYGIQRFTREILFDEKIGGTFHLALGAGYPETGSVNKSAVHWDMICDIRQDSEITLDGTVIYKDGAFVI